MSRTTKLLSITRLLILTLVFNQVEHFVKVNVIPCGFFSHDFGDLALLKVVADPAFFFGIADCCLWRIGFLALL